MTKKELEERIRSAVSDYIIDEETYDDNAQLVIVPATFEVYVEDSRNVDIDSPETDCYDVMDFVEFGTDVENPGKWIVDEEAVASVAGDYF